LLKNKVILFDLKILRQLSMTLTTQTFAQRSRNKFPLTEPSTFWMSTFKQHSWSSKASVLFDSYKVEDSQASVSDTDRTLRKLDMDEKSIQSETVTGLI
jgi:hypothetical protein